MHARVRNFAHIGMLSLGTLIAPHAMALIIELDIAFPPGPPSISSSLSGTAEFCFQPADASHPPSPCIDPILVSLSGGQSFHTEVLWPPGPPSFGNLLFSFGGQELVSSGDFSLVLPAFAFLTNSGWPPGPPSLPPLLLLGAFGPGLDVAGSIVSYSGAGSEFATFRITTIPEPGTLALLAIGSLGLALRRHEPCKPTVSAAR